MARGIQAGDKAPDFTLPSQSGDQVRLQDRLGERVVVLYFYPKDNTSGCTAEACAFRDSHETFTEAGADVIGVSSDSAGRGPPPQCIDPGGRGSSLAMYSSSAQRPSTSRHSRLRPSVA